MPNNIVNDTPGAQLQEYLIRLTEQNEQMIFALGEIAASVEFSATSSAEIGKRKVEIGLEKAYVDAVKQSNKDKARADLQIRAAMGAKIAEQEKRKRARTDVTQFGRKLDKQTNATIRVMNKQSKLAEQLLTMKVATDVVKTTKRIELEEEKRRGALEILDSKKESKAQSVEAILAADKRKDEFTTNLFALRAESAEQKLADFRTKEEVVRDTVKFKSETARLLAEQKKQMTLEEVPKIARARADIKESISLEKKVSILETIKSVDGQSAIVKTPFFLEFLKKQEKYGNSLLLGNKEEHAVGLAILKATKQLGTDRKKDIDRLIREQKRVARGSFEDSMTALSKKGGLRGAIGRDLLPLAVTVADVKWLATGAYSFLAAPATASVATGLMVLMAAGGGYALGSLINEKLGISKWAADTFAGKLDTEISMRSPAELRKDTALQTAVSSEKRLQERLRTVEIGSLLEKAIKDEITLQNSIIRARSRGLVRPPLLVPDNHHSDFKHHNSFSIGPGSINASQLSEFSKPSSVVAPNPATFATQNVAQQTSQANMMPPNVTNIIHNNTSQVIAGGGAKSVVSPYARKD